MCDKASYIWLIIEKKEKKNTQDVGRLQFFIELCRPKNLVWQVVLPFTVICTPHISVVAG